MTTESSRPEARDLLAVIQEWCVAHLPGLEVEAAEALAEEVGRGAMALVFETAVGRAGTRAGYEGPRLPCGCGAQAKFVSYRPRWVRGVQGEIHLERAYYHCAACHTGSYPWDRSQGLSPVSFTPRVKRRVAQLCARLTYREAGAVWTEWTGQVLAESTLEALTAEVGSRLRATEDAHTQAWFERGVLPPAAPLAARVVGQRAYLSIDAAKAHVDGDWHDVKVATFSRAERRVERRPDGTTALGGDTPRETQYLAKQEEAADFARRLYVWSLGLGAERAELIVLGDGAEWIWKLVNTHFSDAVQILDFYHASEHLWDLARAVFGGESPAGKAWAEAASRELEAAGTHGLLRSLRKLRDERRRLPRELSAEARVTVKRELQYFRRHRRRMQYPTYRRQGMMIGSGPVEAACKIIVGQRLKGAGMRWSQSGADTVLAVRTTLLSKRYESLEGAARAA